MEELEYEPEHLGILKTDVTSTDKLGTVSQCLHDTAQRAATPEHLKKYRRSQLYEPGKPYVHWGAADNRRPTDVVYGRPPAHAPERAAEALRTAPVTAIAAWELEQREAVYASNKREPLGRSMQRGHVMPPGLGTERAFGVAHNVRENALKQEVKAALFPPDATLVEPPEIREQYIRTHGRFDPGEQRRRGYDWAAAGADPSSTVFGRKAEYDPFGVAAALNPSLDRDAAPPSVVSARLAAFRLVEADPLGKSHTRGAGPLPALPPGHAFGKPRKATAADAGGVRAVLTRDYLTREQLLDVGDLGRSRVRGAAPADPARVYGVPSVRRDIAPPAQRSVADHRAFGNEAGIGALLAPPSGAERGVFEEDFRQPMPRDEMRAFFAAAGAPVGGGDELFDAMYARAAEVDGRADGLATLNTFSQLRLWMEAQQ